MTALERLVVSPVDFDGAGFSGGVSALGAERHPSILPLPAGRYKAIVVKRSWAWAIAIGAKRFENRTWATRHRGELVLVAGQTDDPVGHERLRQWGLPPVPADFASGAAVAVLNVTDVVTPTAAADPWATGPKCWRLADVRRIVPLPVRGMPGLFSFVVPAGA